MARLFLAQRRNTEAEALLQNAIPVLENSRQPDDPCLAIALTNLAEAYRIDGRYAKAEPFYRQVLAIVRQNPEQENAEIVEGLNHFSAMLRKTKRKAEARDLDHQIKSILPKP
jgi:tetratricopeptide (TPR) repeat protein